MASLARSAGLFDESDEGTGHHRRRHRQALHLPPQPIVLIY